MSDFEMNGTTYRIAKLSAMKQLYVLKRVMPLISSIKGDSEDGPDKADPSKLFDAVSKLPDEDLEYVISCCLADCRRVNGDTSSKIYVGGSLMFEDIGVIGLVKLTIETLKENLADFFTELPSVSGVPA